ncbi:RSP_2648 family PIN domain-containing protein [Gymnodinialimonas ceratoperidinii]|uniref:PIN domain-containing protein n=1 Tax=Gymnodinialimonas ceratoperidinii TaxID=2856823 RepID=A0A8F6YBE4_9RHOB|nr:PIN domain-containing protein [Gymnodinialimonas ceratoperidinii]QXT38092.1 PIN domain-containing protein [Gymnodinialimonas ceratoperidinii]
MIAVIDACVLYPTVLRQIVFGCAERGLIAPRWSDRLLEEWTRAAARNGGALDAELAQAEVTRANLQFPEALTPPGDEAPLWLPDPADVHVLATAIQGGAEVILTQNLKDFPARELSGYGIRAVAPDALLMDLWLEQPDAVAQAVAETHAEAERLSGQNLPLRGLLKRVRLPRLGKALSA